MLGQHGPESLLKEERDVVEPLKKTEQDVVDNPSDPQVKEKKKDEGDNDVDY
jgi:hypothetical protein